MSWGGSSGLKFKHPEWKLLRVKIEISKEMNSTFRRQMVWKKRGKNTFIHGKIYNKKLTKWLRMYLL